jgi:hypothetical protein
MRNPVARLVEQLLANFGRQAALAGQNPQIVPARPDDQRPAVVALIERAMW